MSKAEITEELDVVYRTLELAKDLRVEVVREIIGIARHNPQASIMEICEQALECWDII